MTPMSLLGTTIILSVTAVTASAPGDLTTTIRADIRIEAPRPAVWGTLANLETLQDYDHQVVKSFYVTEAREGVGAARQCDLPDGTHVTERVVSWREEAGYVLEINEDDNYPTTDMRVEFTLEEAAGGTRVGMTYRYALKPGVSADAGEEIELGSKELVAGVLAGLKKFIETGEPVVRETSQ